MEDLKEKADQYKDQFMSKAGSVDQGSVFFTFSNPFTKSIDDGTIFTKFTGLIYSAVAIIFLCLPFYVLYEGFDNNIFDAPFKYVFLAILFFAAFTFCCWVSFQILFNRKNQFQGLDRSRGYVATSIAANVVSTFGEILAVFWAVIGTVFSVLALIFDDASSFTSILGFEGMGSAIVDVIYFPITAFLILVFFRWAAELIVSLADIARNTRR